MLASDTCLAHDDPVPASSSCPHIELSENFDIEESKQAESVTVGKKRLREESETENMISDSTFLKLETESTVSEQAFHPKQKYVSVSFDKSHDHLEGKGLVSEAAFPSHPRQRRLQQQADCMPKVVMVCFSVGELDKEKGDAFEVLGKDLLTNVMETSDSNRAEMFESSFHLNFPSFSSANWNSLSSEYSKLGRVYMPHVVEKLECGEDVVSSLVLDSLEKDWATELRILRGVRNFHLGEDQDLQTYSPLLLNKLKHLTDNYHNLSNATRNNIKVKTRIIDVIFSKPQGQVAGSYSFQCSLSAKDFLQRFFLLRLMNSDEGENSRNVDAFVLVFNLEEDKNALIDRSCEVRQQIEEDGANDLPTSLCVVDWQDTLLHSDTYKTEKDMREFLRGWRSELNEAYFKVHKSQIPADAIILVSELDRTRQRPPFELSNPSAVETFLERIQAVEDCQKVRTIVLKLCVGVGDLDAKTDKKELLTVWDMEPKNIGVYPVQMQVGGRIVARVEYAMEKYMSKKLENFDDIRFLVFLPPYSSLRDQTVERIRKLFKTANDSNVLMYNKINDNLLQQFRKSVMSKPEILHVIIADECHWGVNMYGQFDKWVNDRPGNGELLYRSNFVQLLVSATPYNNLTAQSRIPFEVITQWTDGISETKPLASIELTASSISGPERMLPELHVIEWFGKDEAIRPGSYRRFEGFLRTIWSEKRHKKIGMLRADAELNFERIRTDSSFNALLGLKNAESAKIDVLISDYVFSLVYFRFVILELFQGKQLNTQQAAIQIMDKFKQHASWETYLTKILEFVREEEDDDDCLAIIQRFISKKKDQSMTETDLILKDLLIRPDPLSGRMKVIRVYGHEEALKFVTIMRKCRDDLFPAAQKPFAVFMDDSRIDIQQGLLDEGLMDRPVDIEINNKHFKTLRELRNSEERKEGKLQFKDLEGIDRKSVV